MAGFGGAVKNFFPGFEQKIWMKIPVEYRRMIIINMNKNYDASMHKMSVVERKRFSMYARYVLDKMRPNNTYTNPHVDYKRHKARGTLVEGTDYYIQHTHAQNRLLTPFQPFTEEEQQQRTKYKFQNMKFYIGVAIAASLIHGLIQTRPVAWCLEKPAPHPPSHPFWFKSVFHSHDIPSVRRGYEVYRKVCATCHSMELLHFRHLVNEVLPEARVKQLAATYDYTDGPNDEGEMFERPGLIHDPFPKPYPNAETAKYANGGAYPPDLSVLAGARHNGPDYIYSLLTGYRDPPEGIELRGGLYYNTYFPGGAIAMPPPLLDDMLEYEDGTPCNISQMAKDVTNFITWATEPSHDDRKLEGLKAVSSAILGLIFVTVWFRFYWAIPATRRIDFGKLKTL